MDTSGKYVALNDTDPLSETDDYTTQLNAQIERVVDSGYYDIIPNGTDLNTYITTTQMHQNANAQATLALNYPVTYAGMLEVFQSGAMVYQRYTTYQTGNTAYIRGKYSSTWGPWKVM